MASFGRIVGIQELYPYLFAPVAQAPAAESDDLQMARSLDRLLLLTGNIILAYQFREARDDEEMSTRVRQYLAEPSRDRLADLHLTVSALRPAWLSLLFGFPETDAATEGRPARDELAAALDAYRRFLEARENAFGGAQETPPDLERAEANLLSVLKSGLNLAFRRADEADGEGLWLVRPGLDLNLFPFCLAEGKSSLLLFSSCGSAGLAYVDAAEGTDVVRRERAVVSALAEVYLSLGQYARAKAVLSDLRDRGVIGPDDPTLLAATYALYGFRCYQKADFDKSAQCFEQSLKLRPDLVRSYYQLCLAYTKKGNAERAIECLHRLADRYPKQRKTFELLGDLFCEQENFSKALLMYDRAVSLEPVPALIERKRDRVREKIEEGRRSPREALARARVKGPAKLAEFLSDMTREAELGLFFPIVGREAEIAEIIEILSCRDKRNPLLVGEAGVGKSAVVEELAMRIAEGRVPAALAGKRLYLMSVSTILAGAKFRGQFEERFLELVKDLRDDNSILFIDNIQTVIASGTARGGGLDAAALLKPALVKNEIQIIGTTTYDEYQANIEKDPSLTRCFQLVRIDEPDLDATRAILLGAIPRYETFHGVRIDAPGLGRALPTMRRALRDGSFPDRALDILDRACARVALSHGTAMRREGEAPPLVGEDDLLSAIAGIARVPQPRLAATADARLQEIEASLRRRIIGQEEAVSSVARLLRTAARGLKLHPLRPNGVFLFVGPTGVGKTELSRAMAEWLFGSDEKMIRIDMSEYMERFASSRLIGSPPGYVGYNDTNQLTDRIRQTPCCLLLLDEIEKADPQMMHLFLQVFDAGRLTDARGRTVSFSDVTIVMTSNSGTELFGREEMGYARPDGGKPVTKKALLRELKRVFPPEFLNRIDEIICFDSLAEDQMAKIARLQLKDLAAGLEREGRRLVVTDAAAAILAREGFHPEFGARHLSRALRRLILEPLAGLSLSDDFRAATTITADADGTRIRLTLGFEPPPTDEAMIERGGVDAREDGAES